MKKDKYTLYNLLFLLIFHFLIIYCILLYIFVILNSFKISLYLAFDSLFLQFVLDTTVLYKINIKLIFLSNYCRFLCWSEY